MGNPEHLEILRQGVDVWNKWREDNPKLKPNLEKAMLRKMNLKGAYLQKTNLQKTNLRYSDLGDSNISQSDLSKSDLFKSNLRDTDLRATRLCFSNLSNADLRRSLLDGADFSNSFVGWTVFGDVDLGNVVGLDKVHHHGPSTIGLDTVYRSKGKIPPKFLRRAGVLEIFIDFISSFTDKALEYYSCFISYSSKNQDFVERIHADLQNEGVRCWFAPKDLKTGDKIRQRIDESILIHDKLLLVLSEQSINSKWVEKEVETAFEKESPKKTVLFPLRLDNTVMETDQAWAADIRRTRHIGDFTIWKDHNAYKKAFKRLLRDLKAEG